MQQLVVIFVPTLVVVLVFTLILIIPDLRNWSPLRLIVLSCEIQIRSRNRIVWPTPLQDLVITLCCVAL